MVVVDTSVWVDAFDPTAPQYDSANEQRVTMSTDRSAIDEYSRLVDSMRASHDCEEARQWLTRMGDDYGVIHEISHADSVDIVESVYARGATLVEVLGQFESDEGEEQGVDMLLVHLPADTRLRGELFELEGLVAAEMGFQGCVDEGQSALVLRWT